MSHQHQLLLNQAIAAIQGTLTEEGLLVGGTLIKTQLSRSYYRYVEKHPIVRPYEALFRVWPRTDKAGTLSKVAIVAPDTTEKDARFSGQVIWKGDTLLTIRVSPIRNRIKPFLLTLVHDGLPYMKYGWSMQFACEFSSEDFKFHVKEAISLKHLVCPSDTTSDVSTPIAKTDSSTKELIAV